MTSIEIRDVSFSYASGRKGGIEDISLRIEEGETVLIVGNSGCGKTTVTRLINGLVPHFYEGVLKGDVIIGGVIDVKSAGLHEIAKRVGSIFQNPRSQFFNVDTDSEIAFSCENMMIPAEEIDVRVSSTVEEMGISRLLHRSIFELSGGEKQKIACACVRAYDPDIYVFDEPSSNLDVDSIGDLHAILKKIKRSGKTVIIAEHRLAYLKGIADRVIYMSQGKIVREFTADEFYSMTDEELHGMGLRASGSFTVGGDSMSGSDTCMELQDVLFEYRNGKRAVDIKDLRIPTGAVCAIIGPNGAGKTTFIRSLCGLEGRAKGTIMMDGRKLSGRERRKRFFLVMQDVNHQLFTESVMDEVLLSMSEEDCDRAMRILRDLDLDKFRDVHPMALSGGQKQRVAIAAAIAGERNVIVLDEPTSGLDYRHMVGIAHAVKELKGQGKTVIIVTHDPELIDICCEYFIFLENGKARWSGARSRRTAEEIQSFFRQENNSPTV